MFPFLGPLVGIFTLPPFSISGVLDLPYFSGVASNHKLGIQIKTRQAMKTGERGHQRSKGNRKQTTNRIQRTESWNRAGPVRTGQSNTRKGQDGTEQEEEKTSKHKQEQHDTGNRGLAWRRTSRDRTIQDKKGAGQNRTGRGQDIKMERDKIRHNQIEQS